MTTLTHQHLTLTLDVMYILGFTLTLAWHVCMYIWNTLTQCNVYVNHNVIPSWWHIALPIVLGDYGLRRIKGMALDIFISKCDFLKQENKTTRKERWRFGGHLVNNH